MRKLSSFMLAASALAMPSMACREVPFKPPVSPAVNPHGKNGGGNPYTLIEHRQRRATRKKLMKGMCKL